MAYTQRMRLIFLGSGAFGLPTLRALHARHTLLAVLSQPDKPAGRKQQLTPTPIAEWAQQQQLPVFKYPDVNTPDAVAHVASLEPDASIIIAFGQKLGEPLLAALGPLAVNLHASLLPAYRGAAPIQRAMMDANTHTGVCVIGLAQRMDAGPVYHSTHTPIQPYETAGELHDRLALLGPHLIQQTLRQLQTGTLQPFTQDQSRVTLAKKLHKHHGTTDFNLPAHAVRSLIHGLTPWPGCTVRWTRPNAPDQTLMIRRVKDHPNTTVPTNTPPGTVLHAQEGHVATAMGTVQLLELQAPGGKTLPYQTFHKTRALQAGDQLLAVP